jgi:hypothetical protein
MWQNNAMPEICDEFDYKPPSVKERLLARAQDIGEAMPRVDPLLLKRVKHRWAEFWGPDLMHEPWVDPSTLDLSPNTPTLPPFELSDETMARLEAQSRDYSR